MEESTSASAGTAQQADAGVGAAVARSLVSTSDFLDAGDESDVEEEQKRRFFSELDRTGVQVRRMVNVVGLYFA